MHDHAHTGPHTTRTSSHASAVAEIYGATAGQLPLQLPRRHLALTQRHTPTSSQAM